MQSAISVGIDAAFDARIEAMRDELKNHLGLAKRRHRVLSVRHRLAASRAVPDPRTARPRANDGHRGRRSNRKRHRLHRARMSFQRGHGEREVRCKRANRLRVSRIPSPASRSDCSIDNGDCRPQAETDSRVARRDREVTRERHRVCCFKSWIRRSWAGARQAINASTKSRRAGPIRSRSSSMPARCALAARA